MNLNELLNVKAIFVEEKLRYYLPHDQKHGRRFNTVTKIYLSSTCPADWSSRIHRLHLCREIRRFNECLGYDIEKSDGVVPMILELWGMQNTLSLPLLPGPLWP